MAKTKKATKKKKRSQTKRPERVKGGRGMYAVINGNTKEEVTDLVDSILDYSLEHGLEQVEVMSIQPSPAGGWEAVVRAHNWNPFKWASKKAKGAIKTVSESEAGELTKRGLGKIKDVEKQVERVASKPVRFFTEPKYGQKVMTPEEAAKYEEERKEKKFRGAEKTFKQETGGLGRKEFYDYIRGGFQGGPEVFDSLTKEQKEDVLNRELRKLNPETAKQVVQDTLKGRRLKERTEAEMYRHGIPTKTKEYFKTYKPGHWIDPTTGKNVPQGTPGAEYVPGQTVIESRDVDIPVVQQKELLHAVKEIGRERRQEAFARKVEPLSKGIEAAARISQAVTVIHPAAKRGVSGGVTPTGMRGGGDLYRVPIIPPVSLPPSPGGDLGPLRQGGDIRHLRGMTVPRLRRKRQE